MRKGLGFGFVLMGVPVALILAQEAAPRPAGPADAPAVQSQAVGDDTFRVGVEDVLSISVWRDADLTQDVPVRPDGRISLPLLQDIDAAGKTPKELAVDIQRRLKEFLSAPAVTVTVKEVNSLKAYLTGEVVRPGPILLRSQVRLLQGIALAGGMTPFGGRGGIIIYRKSRQGEKVIELSYKDLLSGKKPEDNLILEPGDTVVVR
jgi:polysaccharide biosynthesis/export protein